MRLTLVCLQQPWRKSIFLSASCVCSDILALVFHELTHVEMASKRGKVFNRTVEELQTLVDIPALLLNVVKAGEPLMNRDHVTFLNDAKFANKKLAGVAQEAAGIARTAAEEDTCGVAVTGLMCMIQMLQDSFRHCLADWLEAETGRFTDANVDACTANVMAKTRNSSDVVESRHGSFDSAQKASTDVIGTHHISARIQAVKDKSMPALKDTSDDERGRHIDNARAKAPACIASFKARSAAAETLRHEAEQTKAQGAADKLKREREKFMEHAILDLDRCSTVAAFREACKAAERKTKPQRKLLRQRKLKPLNRHAEFWCWARSTCTPTSTGRTWRPTRQARASPCSRRLSPANSCR